MGFLNEQELEGVVWINGKRNGGVVKTFDKESKKLIIYEIKSIKAKSYHMLTEIIFPLM